MLGTDLPTTRRRLTGWGRAAPSVARVLRTPDAELVAKAVARVADAAASGERAAKAVLAELGVAAAN